MRISGGGEGMVRVPSCTGLFSVPASLGSLPVTQRGFFMRREIRWGLSRQRLRSRKAAGGNPYSGPRVPVEVLVRAHEPGHHVFVGASALEEAHPEGDLDVRGGAAQEALVIALNGDPLALRAG